MRKLTFIIFGFSLLFAIVLGGNSSSGFFLAIFIATIYVASPLIVWYTYKKLSSPEMSNNPLGCYLQLIILVVAGLCIFVFLGDLGLFSGVALIQGGWLPRLMALGAAACIAGVIIFRKQPLKILFPLTLLTIALLIGTYNFLPHLSDALIRAARRVCNGQAISEAASYTSSNEIHPLVAISVSARQNYDLDSWTESVPLEWWPQSIEDLELVLCVTNEYEEKVGDCGYTDGSGFSRYRHYTEIELRLAVTGEIIDNQTFEGTMPDSCPGTAAAWIRRMDGSSIDINAIHDWLNAFVLPVE